MDLPTVEAVLTGDAALERAGWTAGDAFLGGGTWLFSEPQDDLRLLRDLTTLGWPPLTVTATGWEIAATCTLAHLHAFEPPADWTAAHALVRPCCEALLGSFKIWNVATVGGNICLGLPAGPMTSLAAALDARARILAPDGGVREVPVADFVRGTRDPALAPGELLRAVVVDTAPLSARAALRRFSLHPQGRSAALVTGRLDADGRVVVTVTASVPRPLQLRFDTLPTVAEATDALGAAGPRWYDDVHGAPAWRAAMTRRGVAEVVTELAGAA